MTYWQWKVDLHNCRFKTLQWIPIESQVPTIAWLCIVGLLTLASSPDPLCLPHTSHLAFWLPFWQQVHSPPSPPRKALSPAVPSARNPTDLPPPFIPFKHSVFRLQQHLPPVLLYSFPCSVVSHGSSAHIDPYSTFFCTFPCISLPFHNIRAPRGQRPWLSSLTRYLQSLEKRLEQWGHTASLHKYWPGESKNGRKCRSSKWLPRGPSGALPLSASRGLFHSLWNPKGGPVPSEDWAWNTPSSWNQKYPRLPSFPPSRIFFSTQANIDLCVNKQILLFIGGFLRIFGFGFLEGVRFAAQNSTFLFTHKDTLPSARCIGSVGREHSSNVSSCKCFSPAD